MCSLMGGKRALVASKMHMYFMDFFFFRDQGIQGKEVTPFVLQKVNEITKGQSLYASILEKKWRKLGFRVPYDNRLLPTSRRPVFIGAPLKPTNAHVAILIGLHSYHYRCARNGAATKKRMSFTVVGKSTFKCPNPTQRHLLRLLSN